MKNEHIRRLLLFFLCFSLLLSLASPAYADETTDTGTFLATSLPADIVTSSLFNGIGVLPGENPQEYKSIVQRCVDYLVEQGRVVDGKIEVWQREQVGDYSLWKYGVDVSMVEVVRSWLFDNDVVRQEQPNSSEHLTFEIGTKSYSIYSEHPCCLIYGSYPDGNYIKFRYWLKSYEQFRFVNQTDPVQDWSAVNQTKRLTQSLGTASYWTKSTIDTIYDYKPSVGIDLGTFANDAELVSASGVTYDSLSQVVTPYPLLLGYVPNISKSIAEGYDNWYANSVAIPLPGAIPGTDEDVKVIPFAPGQTLDDTLSIPQQDVWDGLGSYVDSPAVPGTASLSDVITAVLSLPGTIVQSIGDLFFPAVDGLTMSLTEFFPFCIPYDLFEFFTLLRAAPEAPVFEWIIPVPQLGRTFEIKVDLTPWDPVAQLFRNLELLAFIVGLAYVTREKFLRS